MKKYFLLCISIALFFSCKKKENIPPSTPGKPDKAFQFSLNDQNYKVIDQNAWLVSISDSLEVTQIKSSDGFPEVTFNIYGTAAGEYYTGDLTIKLDPDENTPFLFECLNCSIDTDIDFYGEKKGQSIIGTFEAKLEDGTGKLYSILGSFDSIRQN